MIRSNNLRAAIAVVLFGLAGAPAFAEDAALQKEVEALRAAMAEQRAQLEAQAKLLEAQQAQLEALTRKLEPLKVAAQEPPKLAAQEAPKVSFTNNRPTITAADGRSSIAVRANVQMDGALYGESPAGPLTTDFRRGSVGAPPNREINGARDFNDGFVFRRARFGIEGSIAKDFNYRLLMELGGSATESTKINDAWIAYTGLAPFTFQLGAYAPPANMDDSTSAEDLPFLERAASAELARSLAGADGRLGLGVKGSGKRWMSALTFTTRTANDAEVFDTQLAAVARAGFLAATSDDYNLHVGASGTYVFQFADQGFGTSPRYPLRLRERPEVRVDGTRLIDTGSIDAEHASIYGIEFGANWKNFYAQGEHFWYDIERRASTLDDPDFAGYYLQGSWIFTGERRRYNAATGAFQNPRPATAFSGEGGLGAFELAARYSSMNLNFAEGIGGTAAAAGAIRG